MRAIHLICWLVFTFFLGPAISADDANTDDDRPGIGKIFRISKGGESGNCDAYMEKLDRYFEESRTFSKALDEAINVVDTRDEQKTRTVQKLLTSWFGIHFDADTGEVMQEDFPAWDIFTRTAGALAAFVEDGDYVTASDRKPFIFCDGNFGNHFGWSANAKYPDGEGIKIEDDDPDEEPWHPTIREVYGQVPEHETEPYWVVPLGGYVFLREGYGANLCEEVIGKPLHYGFTCRGTGPIAKIHSGSPGDPGNTVNIPSFPDGFALCPRVMQGKVDPKPRLQDVPYVNENSDTLLTDILPESSTLFHELTHLVTAWHFNDDGEHQPVLDWAIDLDDCTELAMGTLEDEKGKPIPKINAVLNAESYVYFAMSYWYVDQEWSGQEPITFYMGIPESVKWVGTSG